MDLTPKEKVEIIQTKNKHVSGKSISVRRKSKYKTAEVQLNELKESLCVWGADCGDHGVN